MILNLCYNSCSWTDYKEFGLGKSEKDGYHF